MSPSPSLLSISSPGSMEVVGGSIARVDSRGRIGIAEIPKYFLELIEIENSCKNSLLKTMIVLPLQGGPMESLFETFHCRRATVTIVSICFDVFWLHFGPPVLCF